jgi:hypothetical protein
MSRIRVLAAIFISFLFVSVFSSQIFIGSTPRVNPSLGRNVLQVPNQIIAMLKKAVSTDFFAGKQSSITQEELFTNSEKTNPRGTFKPISRGVSAAENNYYIKIESGTTLKVYTYTTSSGKTIEILVPQ